MSTEPCAGAVKDGNGAVRNFSDLHDGLAGPEMESFLLPELLRLLPCDLPLDA